MILLSPVFIITALAIYLESGGPVVYRSKRVGQNYQIFDFFKFRSMYRDADARLKEFMHLNQYQTVEDGQGVSALPEDCPRCSETEGPCSPILFTDSGATCEYYFKLKKHQQEGDPFVKLKNDPRITRVGRFIRKTSIDELPQLFNVLRGELSLVGNRALPLYEAEQLTVDEAAERFAAPAGITGLWQVTKRGKAEMSADERIALDVAYARRSGLWTDLQILFKTIPALLQSEDV